MRKRRIIFTAVGAALGLAMSAATCGASATSAGPTTYYVNAQTGADTNSGSSAGAPWKTIAKANAVVQAGDTVVLSGNFVQQAIAPGHSGTATAPITYRADSAGATLDQPGFVGRIRTYMAWFGARSYITVDGIGFTNSNYVNAPVENKGIVLNSSSYVTIENCQFSHVQMQLIGSSHNLIENNIWRQFISQYVNVKPETAGDMLNLVLGSHDNEIVGNDMKYAGHSLIQIGNGTGNGETNPRNWIHGNTLSNPWYKDVILSDNGAGTVVEGNQLLDANRVPTLISTVAGQVGQLNRSSEAVQFSGENFILRNNTIANAISTYGVVTLGGRWYVGPGAAPGGTLVESLKNQVYGNTIRNCKGAATFSFVEFRSPADIAAGRTAVPRITGNLIHDNTIVGASGTPYSFHGSRFYSTVIYHSATEAPRWKGLHGNKVYNNRGFSRTHGYLIDGVFPGGVTVHKVQSLAQFEATHPAYVYRNS